MLTFDGHSRMREDEFLIDLILLLHKNNNLTWYTGVYCIHSTAIVYVRDIVYHINLDLNNFFGSDMRCSTACLR